MTVFTKQEMYLMKKTTILFIVSLCIIPLFLTGCADEDDPLVPEEHFKAIGMVFETSGIRIASILRGETGDTLLAPLNDLSDHIEVRFYNNDEELIDPPQDNTQYKLSWSIDDEAIAEVWQHEGEEGVFEFHLRGLQAGMTEIEFFIMHGDHNDYRSGKLPLRVQGI